MKKSPVTEFGTADLRSKAEQYLRQKSDGRYYADMNMHRLVHELQIHQIELEMQNEELQLAQAQTAAVLERYTRLYDFAPVGYLVLDKTGLVTEMNLTAASILGVSRNNVIGQSLVSYFNEGSSFQEHLTQASEATGNVIAEFQIQHTDDGVRDVQLESRGSKEDGNLSDCIHSIMTDISSRKILERELQLRADREARLKQEMVMQTALTIAHELNQPLAALSIYSEVAIRHLDNKTENSEELLRALAGCVEQAQSAGGRLHELLNLFKKGALESNFVSAANPF